MAKSKFVLLRQMRLEKNLSQAEVAKKMKISPATYGNAERGIAPAWVDLAIKTVSGMRARTDRTAGGKKKVGWKKSGVMRRVGKFEQ